MSDFRKTGDYLRKKYNGAIQVIMNQDGTGFTVANKNFRKPTKTDLVYFENSPDYCVMDKSAGTAKISLRHLQQLSLPPSPPPLACNPQGCSSMTLGASLGPGCSVSGEGAPSSLGPEGSLLPQLRPGTEGSMETPAVARLTCNKAE